MTTNLETWVNGAGAALLLIPAAAGIAYSATRSVFRRRSAAGVGEATVLPEVGTALGEIETLLDEIHGVIEDRISEQVSGSPAEPGVARASEQINEITDTIQGIVDEVRALADPALAKANAAEQARLPFPVVLSEMAMFEGHRRARIFFKTGSTFDTSGQAYTLKIAGNRGSQELTFASGTAQADVAQAISQFAGTTGVTAFAATSGLVLLTSMRRGSGYFVGAKRVSGNRDGLLLNEWKRRPANRKLDFGE